MPDPASYPSARAKAAELVATAKALDVAISQDPDRNALPGFSEYAGSETADGLRRAEALLAKDHYKLCFAGGFSAGKSTTINALLEDPDLLPTAAGECTLSITVCTGPLGGRELVRVRYFPRDVAIKNVVFHQKRYRNAFKLLDAKIKGAGSDQLIAATKEVIELLPRIHADENQSEALRKEFDKGKALKYAGELAEFLMYLEKFADRMGRIHEDELKNKAQYLTYDDKQGGLGHLFLVEQVIIHKRNVLFEEKGIQIIDLPGIDSTNAYARQVTLDYLNEADLVINVLPPQGFTMSYIDIINEMSEANRGNISNKMFYIINRFDANEERNFTKKELEALLRDQIAAEIDKNGLNSRNLFAACAILDIHRLRGNTVAYDAMMASCKSKMSMMGDNVEQPWRKIAEDALTGRGITVVRDTILKYLQEQLAFERLRDVSLCAKRTIDAAEILLARNATAIADARGKQSTQVARIREFIEKANQNAEGQLLGLATALPGMVNQVVQGHLKGQVSAFVGNFRKIPLADPTKQVAFTGNAAKLQTPLAIKSHWLDWAKHSFSDKLVELAEQTLVGNVQMLLDQQIKAAKIDDVVEHVGKSSGRPLAEPLRRVINEARSNIAVITRLRASEETWVLRSQPLNPSGLEPAWSPAVEEAFKNDVINNFTKILSGYADRLGTVLGLYYQAVIKDLVVKIKGSADELEQALRSVDNLDLPLSLVGGDADPDEARKLRLLGYSDQHVKVKAVASALAPALKA